MILTVGNVAENLKPQMSSGKTYLHKSVKPRFWNRLACYHWCQQALPIIICSVNSMLTKDSVIKLRHGIENIITEDKVSSVLNNILVTCCYPRDCKLLLFTCKILNGYTFKGQQRFSA